MISLHKALLSALEIERDAMGNLDGVLISDCAQTKQSILNEIITNEAERIRIVEALGKYYSSKKIDTISDLLGFVDEVSKNELLALQDVLKKILNSCKLQNQINMNLASASLDRIDTMKRNILGQKNNNGENYNAQGSRNPVTKHGGRLISERA